MQDGDQLQRMEIRIRALEQTEHSRSVREAREEERQKNDAAEFARLHARLDRIDNHVSRVVWLVMAAILGALVTFVISGGTLGA